MNGPVLALDQIYLGDTNFAGQASATAWQDFGMDVDGLTTAADFSAHCLPNNGANPATAFPDASGGIDNAFGKAVLPILLGLNPDLPDQANMAIDSGSFTLVAFFEGLQGADQSPLTTYLWGGAPLLAPPLWNGSDCWQAISDDVTDPNDVLSAKLQFNTSSVTADLWESGSTITLVVPINILGYSAPLTIYHARMEAQLAPSHLGAALGQIGGVVDTEEFAEVVRDVAGFIDPTLCVGTIIDSLMTQIRQASDIMNDGTQDPMATCDGISVGLGFTMLSTGIDGVAPQAPPQADPCP
jgi:hypothetical protein